MKDGFRAICLSIAAATSVLLTGAGEAPRLGKNAEFIDDIPDVTQTAARGPAYGDGQQFCAPAAAANSLSWLAGSGDAEALMRKLSSNEFMNTSLKNGTGASGFLRGVGRYARATFGSYKRLELRGWRSLKGNLKNLRGSETITPEWLAKGVGRKSTVWMNIGWYKYRKSTNAYWRIGGHWVTLVGYDFTKSTQLIIHDPAPRAGAGFKNHFLVISTVDSGTLQGRKQRLPRPAVGSIRIERGLHIKPGATVALIDAAIRLEL
ncbi:MAG: C39 family peptidase [Hyphomicrobiaceae bacterium]